MVHAIADADPLQRVLGAAPSAARATTVPASAQMMTRA